MAFVVRKLAGRFALSYVNGWKLLRCASVSGKLPVCQLKISTTCCREVSGPKESSLLKKSEEEKPDVKLGATTPSPTPSSDAYSADKLFSAVDTKAFSVADVLSLLNNLAELTDQGYIIPESYNKHPQFEKLCEQLLSYISFFNHVDVVRALRSLLTMGLDPEHKTVQYFENEVLWRMRKMSFKTLSICLHYHCRYTETEMQMRVFTALVNAIKARWVEISDADDVIKNIQKVKHFDEQFLLRVEERSLSIVDKMTLEELQKLVITLANCNRRPIPLLRSISYHFTRCTDKLTAKQTINMLHSLNTLNYSDQGILQKLSTDILPEIAAMNGKSIYSLLTTTGQLKWRYPVILDACCQWILHNLNSCGTQEIVACILTLGSLNYHPEEEDKLFSAILPMLNRRLVAKDTVWLDVVVSLAILGIAASEHLASVLIPAFYNPLCENAKSSEIASVLCKLKILNINAVAKIEIPQSKLTIGSLGNAFDNVQIPQSKQLQQSQESVISSLSNFLPRGKFMATNLNTALGFSIDAEFIMDKHGKPMPLLDYGIKAGLHRDVKPLPTGSNRVALLIWYFKDYTLNTTSLLGKNALAVRLLTKIGYKVIEVNYSEFQEHNTVVKKVQYLQQIINEKLKETDSKDKG